MSLPELVWNRGIAAHCDWRIPDEFPNGVDYIGKPDLAPPPDGADLIENAEFYQGIRDGDLVWVRLTWLGSFVRQVVPFVDGRFVLVTGDSIQSVPSDVREAAEALLNDRRVIRWFAQNCKGCQGGLLPLPIGLDFHTVSEKPYWGEEVSSPADQEREVKAIGASLPPVESRSRKVYLDFVAMATNYGGRAAIAKSFANNPCAFFQQERLSRSEMWRRRGDFAFVVSPPGWGLDCHRTWEALVLGHIVLVPASPLDRLYMGLPVVSISDWNEVTPAKLDMWVEMYGPLTLGNPRWNTRWWTEKMRAVAAQALQG